jgi:hypothetical protein
MLSLGRLALQLDGLPLPSGNIVHVIHLLKSWKAPHAVELPGQNGTFRFPKRTNKGTEYMPISEVQAMFLNLQDRRRKLDLMRSELDVAASQAREIVVEDKRDSTKVSLVKFDLTLLNSVIGETYSLLQTSPELVASLPTGVCDEPLGGGVSG